MTGLSSHLLTRHNLEKQRYVALQKWNESLESIHVALVGKIAGGSRAAYEGGGMSLPAETLFSGAMQASLSQ